MPSAVFCFRYVTPALQRRWHRSEEEAAESALQAGQAYLCDGEVLLFEFVQLERQPAHFCLSECAANL
jgi:hypothetical protein